MARYRKVDIRVWGDEKFRRLSSPQPNGQTLWFHLMTGPHTSQIPGVSSIGEMALAENLDWPLEGFRKAFQEVFREGLAKADWKARVLWLPNAIGYNKPESPNVVKSWSATWDEIPECELKNEIYQYLKDFLKGLGESFVKAFNEACEKPSRKTLANYEQEQEQEQEYFLPEVPPQAEIPKKPKRASQVPEEFPVTAEMREYAKKLGVARVDAETEHFLDHHRARGTLFKDWNAAWRTWVRNSIKFNKSPPPPKDEWATVKETLRGAL